MEAKRARFKGPKNRTNYSRRGKFDGFSARAEASEDPPMPVAEGGEPKTSEFAYFKRLKQGVGRTSRMNSVNKERVQEKYFGPAYNRRESGDVNIGKDLEAPLCAKKPPSVDVGSFLHPQDVSMESGGLNRTVADDTEKLGSSPAIRTPTSIDLDNILSTSAAAPLNSETQPQHGDIFSAKRLKLQQWISKTLLLEADNQKLPKECDVVSLLLSRLLPESSSKIPRDSKNHKEPECQEHLRDSSFEFEECWDGKQNILHTNMDQFIGAGISDAYREAHPSQKFEDVNPFLSMDAGNILVSFREGNDSLYEIDPERWSNIFDDRNLLTWCNDRRDYSTDCKISSNIFTSEVDDYSNHGKVSSNISMNEVDDQFRINTPSYELPTLCYDQLLEHVERHESPDCNLDRAALGNQYLISSESFGSPVLDNLRDSAKQNDFVENCRRNCLEYKGDQSDCELDGRAPDSWQPVPVSFKTFRSSAFCNFRDSDEINKFDLRDEHSPLLLPWATDDSKTENDMDHEAYLPVWRADDHCSSVYPSIFPSSSGLHSSSDTLQDRQHWLQPKDIVGMTRCAPFTVLYSPDQLIPDDTILFKDIFRGGHLCVVSEDLSHQTKNILGDGIFPAADALLTAEGLDIDIGFKSKSLYDVHRHLRQKRPSSHVLHEYGKSLEMPQPETLSLTNVDISAQPEVLFPLKLHRIRWLDTAVEANDDDLQVAALFR